MRNQPFIQKFLFFTAFTLSLSTSYAQNVGIGTTTPDPSAMLDIVASNKGILIPRAETSAVTSPVEGLLVFQPSTQSFYYYSSGSWKSLGGVIDADGDTKITANDQPANDDITFKLDGEDKLILKRNVSGELLIQHQNFSKGGTFVGRLNGENNTGVFNTGLGTFALQLNTSGASNTALGVSALNSNTNGSNNTAVGVSALLFNKLGNENNAFGHGALSNNTDGSNNVAIGASSLYSNTTRSNLIAIGDSSLYHNGIGASFSYQAIENVALGRKALYQNTTGRMNTALGNNSLMNNTTGVLNTAVGFQALNISNSGSSNVAIGESTLFNMMSGGANTAIGTQSLWNNQLGSNNISLGWRSGFTNINGSNNVFIGAQAGYNEIGSNKLYIENSNADSTAALIFGNFDNNNLIINADTKVNTNNFGKSAINATKTSSTDDVPAVLGMNKTTNFYGIGVRGEGGWKGVEGVANVTTGADFYYGVVGTAIGGNTGTNYGIYGNASGAAKNFGGFFIGDAYISGNTSIGGSSGDFATGYKLSVVGKVACEEVLVDMKADWPDYVFKSDYNLKTLDEIKKHINEHGHLPNVPSAEEVEKNGLLLGNMNKILLEKIEELTLYILQQEERIKKLEEKE